MIKALEISKSFTKEVNVINQLRLEVQKGHWVSIVGPSGTGKSTLLNCISGLLRPDTGEVLYDGNDIYGWNEGKRSDFRRKHIGFVFQDFKLLPYYSVLDNVILPLLSEAPKKELYKKAKNTLQLLGMDETLFTRLPEGLSGGEKQRVAIARSLIANPDVLICDEPTGNLDQYNRDQIIELLLHLREQGKTILLVTHDMEVAVCGDRMLQLKNGTLVPIEVRV